MAPSGVATSKAAEKIEKVEQRIRDDQYDLDAWTILINESQNSGDIAAIRDVYERVLKVFPTSVGFFNLNMPVILKLRVGYWW
jgi:cleavage stimulation factor subunit 3